MPKKQKLTLNGLNVHSFQINSNSESKSLEAMYGGLKENETPFITMMGDACTFGQCSTLREKGCM